MITKTQTIQPYLFFQGKTEEAIGFYQSAVGAEVQMLMRFKDNPDTPQEGCEGFQAPPDKIMHASLRIGGSTILLSDGQCTGSLRFDGFSLALSAVDPDEAARRFNALAEGGQVIMPLGKTFFSPSFGMVADQFGVTWMVIVEP